MSFNVVVFFRCIRPTLCGFCPCSVKFAWLRLTIIDQCMHTHTHITRESQRACCFTTIVVGFFEAIHRRCKKLIVAKSKFTIWIRKLVCERCQSPCTVTMQTANTAQHEHVHNNCSSKMNALSSSRAARATGSRRGERARQTRNGWAYRIIIASSRSNGCLTHQSVYI